MDIFSRKTNQWEKRSQLFSLSWRGKRSKPILVYSLVEVAIFSFPSINDKKMHTSVGKSCLKDQDREIFGAGFFIKGELLLVQLHIPTVKMDSDFVKYA